VASFTGAFLAHLAGYLCSPEWVNFTVFLALLVGNSVFLRHFQLLWKTDPAGSAEALVYLERLGRLEMMKSPRSSKIRRLQEMRAVAARMRTRPLKADMKTSAEYPCSAIFPTVNKKSIVASPTTTRPTRSRKLFMPTPPWFEMNFLVILFH